MMVDIRGTVDINLRDLTIIIKYAIIERSNTSVEDDLKHAISTALKELNVNCNVLAFYDTVAAITFSTMDEFIFGKLILM